VARPAARPPQGAGRRSNVIPVKRRDRTHCGEHCDVVVVSEVRAVALPANRGVDLRCRCSWLSAADR
jgi:hypothetical protein